MRLTVIVALIAVVGFGSASRAQEGIDGDWAITFETPMGYLDASATFKSDGETLTGTLTSNEAGTTSFTGTLKGTTVAWLMNVSTSQGNISVQMIGELDGDSLKGTFDFGQGTGTWTGKRER